MDDERKLTKCEIMLTRNCNLRCRFCFEKNDGYSARDVMAYDDLIRIVDFCCDANVKYIFLTGGEPLLYPRLIDILLYIRSRPHPIETAIATNGLLLADNEFCKCLVENGMKYVDVSMKGKNEEEWLIETGRCGHDKQAQAIRNLSSSPVEFTCSMVVTQDNVGSILERVKSAHVNGARAFSFTFFIDNEVAPENDLAYLEKNSPLALVDAFLSQAMRLTEITDDWWVEYSFPLCVYTEDQLARMKGRLAAPCHISTKDAVIFNPQMELLPCDMYSDMKMGKFGKDFSTYSEFVEFSKTLSYRSVLESFSRYPSDECVSCLHLEACQGGCPVIWKNFSFSALRKYQESCRVKPCAIQEQHDRN